MDVDLDLLAKEIANNNAVIFVGAGFSKNAEPINENIESYFMNWSEFILLLAKKIWPNIKDEKQLKDRSSDYLYLVQLFKDRFGENEFYKTVKRAIPTEDYDPGNMHKLLFHLPWIETITTNMDDLIEKTFEFLNFPKSVVIEDKDLSVNTNFYHKIIKMHGSIERPDSIIFSEEDYRKYEEEHPLMVVKIKQVFAEKTVFFIGFSLTDPNFKKIFLWVNDILKRYQKRAYAFIPNSDKNEIEYWRNRNVVIFNGDNNVNNYSIKTENFINELTDRVKIYNLKTWEDAKNYIFENDKYNIKMKDIKERLEFYKKNNRNKEFCIILKEAIQYNYNIIKKAQSLEGFNQYKKNILEYIFWQERYKEHVWYTIIDNFKHIKEYTDINDKFFYIINMLCEVNDSIEYTFQYYDGDINNAEISFPNIEMKKMNIYDMFVESADLTEKENLIFYKVKDLYYKKRDYKGVLNFISKNYTLLRNLYYKDEVKYIEILCYKHLWEYDKIDEFVRSEGFKLNKSINNLRLGYLNYLVNNLTYMNKYYEKALNNLESNYSNSFTAIFVLNFSRYFFINDKNNLEQYRCFLNNKKEQLNRKINLENNKSIFNIEKEFIEIENKVLKKLNEIEDDDYEEILEYFFQNISLCEYYGVPDIIVTNNLYYNNLFQRNLSEKFTMDKYIDLVMEFGINVNKLNKSDAIINYNSGKKEEIFNKLYTTISKCLDFIKKKDFKYEEIGASIQIRILDGTLKIAREFMRVFNDKQINKLVNLAFIILDIRIRQYNNEVLETAVDIIKEAISYGNLSESVKIFERYLKLIIENNLNRYFNLDIDFIWRAEDLENLNEDLFVQLLNKIKNNEYVFRSQQYFLCIYRINKIKLFTDKCKEKIYEVLINLKDKYIRQYGYLILLDSVSNDKYIIKTIISDFCSEFISEKNRKIEKGDYSRSTEERNQYFILSDFIKYISIEERKKIFELSKNQLELIGDPQNSFKVYIDKTIIDYIVKYSIINNNLSNNTIFILNKYQLELSYESIVELRNYFEKKPKEMNKFVNKLIEKIKSNNKEEKTKAMHTVRRFYDKSTKILEKDEEIIRLLKMHIYSTEIDILKWVVSSLATIIKNNTKWAKNNSDSIFDLWYDNFNTLFIKCREMLIANSYFLNNVYKFCNHKNKKIIDDIVDDIKENDSFEIKGELTNFI